MSRPLRRCTCCSCEICKSPMEGETPDCFLGGWIESFHAALWAGWFHESCSFKAGRRKRASFLKSLDGCGHGRVFISQTAGYLPPKTEQRNRKRAGDKSNHYELKNTHHGRFLQILSLSGRVKIKHENTFNLCNNPPTRLFFMFCKMSKNQNWWQSQEKMEVISN